ncbi:MAG: hypothetical protein KJ720_05210 [Proteobacteria bacterium]|nr:hypothetical protein [Pseudomonadota bacterium]MBU1449775.1 hypothetical protein [Pseudomonadota bacterium]MBU2469012.1 hypothetical protein [Pseudomonadota bacterium]MBU2517232.1 hypothetical protein [Pseudomonadota bacterium]
MLKLKRLDRQRFNWGLLFGLMLYGLLALGCAEDGGNKISPTQAAFKTEMLRLMQAESKEFLPLLQEPDPGPKLQANIDQQFVEGIKRGKPLDYDLAVLGPKASILAWRGPNPENLKETYHGFIGQNYSKFTKLHPVYQDHKIASFEVYTQYGPGLGLCAPLLKDGKLLAVLCLGFDEDLLKEYHHLNKDQFLAIDFNQ